MDDREEILVVDASALIDRGCVRQDNEDAAFFASSTDSEELAARGVLALVADGMGGHRAGEVASGLAAEVIRRAYFQSRADPAAALTEAFEEANRVIHQHAERDARLAGMGTTCTALAIRRQLGYLAHVGDSRLYLLRGGDLLQMTEDHSQVAEHVRQGRLTAEQAVGREDRNVITRALGTAPRVAVATWSRPLALSAGDRLLLCSDGLHEPLERETIRDLAGAGDVRSASQRLLAAAKARSGPDNISLVLLELREPAPERRAAETRKLRVPAAEPAN